MESQPMFFNCPAYAGNDGAAPCGLPAEVEMRYTVRSTDGPLEGARIRCPRGHWFNGPIEFLTVKSEEEHAPGTAGRALGAGPDSCRHQSASPFGGTPKPPKRGSTASRPNDAPAYYLGRPASLWISVMPPTGSGQVDVEQDDARVQLASGRQRLGGVPRLADDLKALRLEQGANRRTEANVVIHDEYPRPQPSSTRRVRPSVIRACPDASSRERSDGKPAE